MTLPEFVTLTENFPTKTFYIEIMHDCTSEYMSYTSINSQFKPGHARTFHEYVTSHNLCLVTLQSMIKIQENAIWA